MTAHGPIERPSEAQADAAWQAITRALSAALDVAERAPNGQRLIGEALCAALDTVGGGAPDYNTFGNLREDAAFWADTATPVEVEAYAGAALARIERTTFAERARKRLFKMLWRSFTDKERADFIKGVTNRAGGP